MRHFFARQTRRFIGGTRIAARQSHQAAGQRRFTVFAVSGTLRRSYLSRHMPQPLAERGQRQ